MATGTAAALQDAIHTATKSHVSKCAAYSTLTLLAYDLLLNISREADLIWRQKWRASTVIYFFLRYPVVAFQVFNAYASVHKTPQCDALYRFTWAFSVILTRIAITASFVLRVYAILGLTRTSLLVGACLGIVGACTVGLDVWQDIQASCTTSSNPIVLLATVLTYFLLAAFDVLTTFVLAVRTAVLIRRCGWRVLKGQKLLTLVVNQGLIYFITVAAVQVLLIVLYYLPQSPYSLILNDDALLIASILLSRFLLDLREMHTYPDRTYYETLTAPKFTPFGGTTDGTSSTETRSRGSAPEIVRDFEDPSSDVLFTRRESFGMSWSADEIELDQVGSHSFP